MDIGAFYREQLAELSIYHFDLQRLHINPRDRVSLPTFLVVRPPHDAILLVVALHACRNRGIQPFALRKLNRFTLGGCRKCRYAGG